MAGAVFGEVRVSLFVAGAVFGEVWTMTLVTPRIVNSVSCVKRIDDESHFALQAQYLVKFKCHFSWQAQYSVKFGMIARSAKCCIFQYKMLAVGVKSNLGREAGCGLVGFMVGSCSDHSRIGRALEMTFHPFSANFFEILDSHFSWQAQYLVSLDYDACCSAHCK